MSTTLTDDEMSLRRAFGAVAGCGVIASALVALSFDVTLGVSVLVGVALVLGNLWLVGRAVQSLLAGGRAALPWSVVAVLKFVVLLGVMYLLVRSPAIRPLGLAIGFVALPVGVVLGSILRTPASPAAGRLHEETDHA